MAATIKTQIHNEQASALAVPSAYDPIIRDTVAEVIAQLDLVPVRRRVLRDEAACKYIGRDVDFLRRDRAEAKREDRPPLFAYRKFGSSVLYTVEDLDAGIDALPRTSGRADVEVAP